ncbi:hypothetical protein [Marinobacter salicampi]|uniref:hypothetical protein n=1 Tax=Marinobacter salicampi TaxID=435907 RepID=UPI00140E6DDB|nr:hypothetical protein [Marinobacter salicampi]
MLIQLSSVCHTQWFIVFSSITAIFNAREIKTMSDYEEELIDIQCEEYDDELDDAVEM